MANDLIYYTDLTSLITRLQAVYTTHALTFPSAVANSANSTRPTSAEITAIFNAFDSAYSEEHLATATKWTITTGELSQGAKMLGSTLVNMNTSLVSMESKTHYSKVTNTAGTTYSQTTNSATTTYTQTTYSSYGTTYSQTTNTATTTYSQTSNGRSCTQNTMRNASYSGNSQCTCHTVYSSDNSRTSNTAGSSYSRSTYTNGTGYSRTIYSSNGITYSQTQYTAGITYTET